jgi:hypothetical protein
MNVRRIAIPGGNGCVTRLALAKPVQSSGQSPAKVLCLLLYPFCGINVPSNTLVPLTSMHAFAQRTITASFMLTFLAHPPIILAAQDSLRPPSQADKSTAAPCVAQIETASDSSATPKPPPIPVIPQGPLGEVDRTFVDSYTARETGVLSDQSPYIVVSGSSLILHHGNAKDSVRVIPDTYHALKDVAHVPFSVYLLLSPVERATVALDAQTDALNRLASCVDAAETALSSTFFSKEQIARQRIILNASLDLMRSTLKTRAVHRDVLLSYTKKMGPLMLQNASDAGCAQITATHAQLMKWKGQLTEDEWKHLAVVNRARHQARYRNAATQYFHWLFGDSGPPWSYPGESARVIYAESLGPGEDASNELAIVEIDADASDAFFADPWRLTEDILSSGAAACIARLPEADRKYSKSP